MSADQNILLFTELNDEMGLLYESTKFSDVLLDP